MSFVVYSQIKISKKIILKRNNLLETYVSKLRADRTRNYLGKSLDGERICINPKNFEKFIQNYHSCYQHYDNFLSRQSHTSVHRATYEELTNKENGEKSFQSILSFLGINDTVVPKSLGVTIKQSNKDNLKYDIINYDEIKFLFPEYIS